MTADILPLRRTAAATPASTLRQRAPGAAPARSRRGHPASGREATFGTTPRQAEALTHIGAALAAGNVPPTCQELAARLALAGRSGAHRLIVALEERGLLVRIPERARALDLTAAGWTAFGRIATGAASSERPTP